MPLLLPLLLLLLLLLLPHTAGGIGKSTLADLLYDKLSRSFTRAARVTLDLDGSNDSQLRDALQCLLKGLQQSLTEHESRQQLLQRLADLLRDQQVLLLLDNVNHKHQLDELLPSTLSSGSRVIITSREPDLAGSRAYAVSRDNSGCGSATPRLGV
jgi:hypothetical protein